MLFSAQMWYIPSYTIRVERLDKCALGPTFKSNRCISFLM